MMMNVKKNSGFTLVELLITISMFVIVTGVVLVNSNRFDSTVLLENFAYDVALTIKQAQSYGVNVRESSTGLFGSAYGVYFNIADVPAGRTNFVLFNDVSNGGSGLPDQIYNNADGIKSCPTENPECVQKYSMTKGTYIADNGLCVGSDADHCYSVNQLSILFIRPSQNALIYKDNGHSSAGNDYAKIILSAANGATSTVVITSVGQIYVKK